MFSTRNKKMCSELSVDKKCGMKRFVRPLLFSEQK